MSFHDAGQHAGGSGVIFQQPGSVWLPSTPVVPRGLEYLAHINQMLVHQKVECCEVLCGCERKNKYKVKNTMNQQIYYMKEDTGCMNRCCCGNVRPFDMDVLDNEGVKVLNFNRPLACMSCCCPCCLQSLTISGADGELYGSVEQDWSIFKPKFSIKDAHENVIFKIIGRCCMCYCCCSDMDFPLLLKDEKTKVGKITKQWTGVGRELFTDADHFGIEFPMDLDVKIKAVLLGACMLIDFMYFEK